MAKCKSSGSRGRRRVVAYGDRAFDNEDVVDESQERIASGESASHSRKTIRGINRSIDTPQDSAMR